MVSTHEKTDGFECSCLAKCPFFQRNEGVMPALAQKLKSEYCLHDNTDCCRLWIRQELGAESVPALMLPHQRDWAEQLLRDAGKTESIRKKAFANSR